jgi:hypothetical protein
MSSQLSQESQLVKCIPPIAFLVNSSNDEPIPLTSQNVYVHVNDQIASYTVDQTYLNDEKNPIEAHFTFPTPAGASVYSFEAKNDEGLVIVCQIKEKTKAKQEYNDAISQGHSAYYMQSESNDAFSVAVGNLPPQCGVQISIKYVVELRNEEDHRKLRINFPTTIMPRYTSTENYSYRSHRAVNPPKVNKKPFNMSIEGDIIASDGIVSLDSKTHRIKLSKMEGTSMHFEIQDLEHLDSDIVLTLERKDSKSHASAQEFKGDLKNDLYRHCTAINIVPDFSRLAPVSVLDVHYAIVLDKSGSMNGADIENCKKAAQQFVGILPVGCTFDVYTFNDSFERLEGTFSSTNVKKEAAVAWIEKITSDGGTEILPVLREIYSSLKKLEKPGVILILSDGGVSDTEAVLRLVKENNNVSVFSIGIGDSVSQGLIQGLALEGNGHAEFIGSGDKASVLQKVRSQLKKSQDTLRKYQKDYKLEIETEEGSYKMVPEKLPTLYDRSNNVVFVFSKSRPVSIKYTETLADSKTNVVDLTPVVVTDTNCALHRMAAIRLLKHLEHEGPKQRSSLIDDLKTDVDVHKDEIIQISTDLNVLSKYTAFVGVEKRKDRVTGKMTLREVPLETQRKYKESYVRTKSLGGGGYSRPRALMSMSPMGYKSKGVSSAQSLMSLGVVKDAMIDSMDSCLERGESCADSYDVGSTSFSKQSKSVSTSGGFTGALKGLYNVMSSTTGKVFAAMKSKDSDDTDNDGDSKMSTPTTTTAPFMAEYKPTKSSDSKKSVTATYKVTVSLAGTYIKLGDILTAKTNGTLVATLLQLLCDLTSVTLKVGDVIELTKETDSSLNTFFEIISLGSDNEPWTLSIC